MSTNKNKKNSGIIDITKTGPLSYRQLQSMNNNIPEPMEGVQDFVAPNPYTGIGELKEFSYGDFGSSKYDEGLVNSHQLEHYDDMRANRQPVAEKWLHGLTKGLGLAATTFLDGTFGLIYGISQIPVQGEISALWDNEFSNGMAWLNEQMEEALPNYRTQERTNNAWFENLGTADFWADSVLKNLGFTVGAYYSGAAWLKALKGVNKVLKAANLAKGEISGTTAQVIGGFMSGLNEARIEANHNQKDFLDLQKSMLDEARERSAMEIAGRDDLNDDQKLEMFKELDQNYNTTQQDALERAHSMGLTTLIGNTILLSVDNLWQFGKLYSRGFNNAKGLANRIEKGAAREGIEDIVEGGVRRYRPKVTSKGAKIARGLSNGLVEGKEEMAQAFIADYAGNRQSYDSPDAYYEALTDPRAQLQTKDFLTSITEGFANTYGNGSRWEEFAVGAFTGLLGMPTFGKVANSDANTWLGRSKSIGISGGVFGEIRSANQAEAEAKEATDVMNRYMDRLQQQAGYFAQSQSFTNAMDGFAAENNNFEYKNASNNDDFAAISRFARTGRLEDLKEMVRQDFENMPDEQLVDIAMNTTPNVVLGEDGTVTTINGYNEVMVGGWRNTDGSLMSDTEEGRQKMREELSKKRDKILNEIDQYEKSVETVRAIGNNSLTEDQVNELAWLNWKTKMFEDRYSSLKSYLDERDILTNLQWTVNNYVKSIENADPSSLSEDASEVKKHMQLLGQYIEALRQSKTAMQLGQLVDANPEFQKALDSPLIEAASGISHDEFVETMTQLQDLAKLGNAANQFNARYKDFVENPINLIKNRQKIDKKKQKVAETMDREDKRTEVRETTVPEIVHAADIGEMSLDELEEMFPDDAEVQGKVKQAQAIRDGSQGVAEIIEEDESINEQTLNDAMKLLEGSKSVATDEEQLLDLEREAFNDPALLYSEDDPTLQDIPSQEELQAVLGERLDNAKTVLSKAIAQLRGEQASAAEATASPETVTPVTEVVDNGEVGRDGVDKVEAINEQKEQPADPVASATNRILQEVERVSTIHDDIRDSYINNLSELVRLTEASKDAGMSMQETYDVVKGSSMWNVLANLNAATGPAYVKWLNDLYAGKTQESPAPRGQEEVEISYAPTEDEAESQVDDIQQAQDDGRLGEILPDQYKYWKPTITELPIHTTRGSRESFHKVAGTMTKKNGTPRFTKQQLQRIEAVGNYLVQNGAYNRVNIGQGVQAGDMVGFRIEKALNDQAGEPVILITDRDGNVIGDIMSMNDPVAVNQTGLGAFTNRILAEYKEAGEPDVFTSQETSVIDKHMVGKVPFTASGNRISLNWLHTNPNGSRMQFKLGIAMSDGPQAKMIMTPGRTKAQGQSAEDLNIIPALTAKQGQPFFLMPTGDRKGRNRYIPVPIVMPKFNEVEIGSAIYKAVQSVVSQIAAGNNSTAAQIGNNLQELLGLQDVHINYNGDNVKVHVRTKGMEHQVQIYNGARNAENLVGSIMQSLQMIKAPIQVSRKYINTTYNGMDYNGMIGEYAMVNLNQGDTHTVSDWFTIRPLDAAGKPIKTVSPRSIGRSSSATATGEKLTTITFNGNPVQVNLKTKEVFFNGQSYQGERANAALAYAYGIENGLDMSNPYQTEWGYFNPNTLQFEPLTVVRTIGAELLKSQQITSLYNNKVVADIEINPSRPGMAGTNPKTFKISLSKPVFTPEEVLAHLKGESGTKFTDQKKEVLNRILTREASPEEISWTMETIEDLLSDEESATTFIIAHERSHQRSLQVDAAAETYNTRVALTEDGQDGYMSPKALEIETRATLEALDAVHSLKPKSNIKKFAESYSGYFEGGGASIEDDYNVPMDDKEALQTIADFENALMSNQITDKIARQFLEVLKKYNPTRYEQDKTAFKGEETSSEPVTTPSRPQSVNPDVEALKMGLLSNSLNRMVWGVLPQDVKKVIVDKTFIIAMQMMTKLRLNYDATRQEFKKPINEILGVEKYREATKSQQFDLNKELSWLSKVLPQFSNAERLQLVNGLTKMDGSTSIFGMFKQGVIYLNTTNQSRGTTYHEAFHAVFNTLMSEKEVADAYQSARNKWGNLSDLELEERLAEDFRIYTEYEQYANESSIKGVFVRLWRKLIRMIRHLLGRDMVLDRLYYDINRGKFSNRNVKVSRVTRSQDAELESIKAQAIADGTFMKAPNGKPTNLTERQWLQVRTKSFKDWFGDWENDTANASKVVDENGEPLIRYHQTTNTFTTFDTNKSTNGETDIETPIGIFTKETKVDILGEWSIQMPLFVNAKNIIKFNTRKEAFEYFNNNIPSYKETARYIRELDNEDPFNIVSEDSYEISRKLKKLITKYLKDSGFDGFELVNDEGISSSGITNVHTIVVFDANQVKSATDNVGTFSRVSDDIRYRVSDDIAELGRMQEEYNALEQELYNIYGKIMREIETAYSHLATKYRNAHDKKTGKKGFAIQDGTTSYYTKQEAENVKEALAPTLGYVFEDNTSSDNVHNYRVMVSRQKPTLETVAASNPEIQDIKEMLATTSQSMDMLRKGIEIQYSLSFDRLDADAQMAILNFGISQDEYAEMTDKEKNNLLYCLGVL